MEIVLRLITLLALRGRPSERNRRLISSPVINLKSCLSGHPWIPSCPQPLHRQQAPSF